ncbi:ATP dependent DNA ligase [Aquipuribacter sp. SD81]|uniref:ATP dependent DNA ligase n=1 Tax=Aquipuribacter sp. SD81 TaxID=3127703 RepID=UPI003018A14D
MATRRGAQGWEDGSLRPMLPQAATAADLPRGEGWGAEVKWDGYRVLLGPAPERSRRPGLRLLSRTGQDLTARFPQVAPLADLVADGSVLDGEVVSLLDGRPDFSALASGDPAAVVRVVVFDVLRHGTADVTAEPLTARRERLAGLPLPACAARSELFDDVDALLVATEQQGVEGVVVKRLASPYRAGTRSGDWRKHAHRRRRTVLVGGWRPVEGRPGPPPGSLLVGAPDAHGDLRFLGRAGSGLGAALAHAVGSRIADAGDRGTSPFADAVPAVDRRGARWCEARVRVEVAYRERTGGGRLRHPVVLGLREDAEPDPWEDA